MLYAIWKAYEKNAFLFATEATPDAFAKAFKKALIKKPGEKVLASKIIYRTFFVCFKVYLINKILILKSLFVNFRQFACCLQVLLVTS